MSNLDSEGAAGKPSRSPDRHNLDMPLVALLSVSLERKKQVLDEIYRGSIPSRLYYILLVTSAGIAAFGLLANSAATVIGAMLVSPLMAPIFGIAIALSRGDLRLLRQAMISEFGGVLLIVTFACVLGLLPFALEVTPEMLARTQPSLIDLIVAAFAGLAGGLAMVDERTSPALPGVAIATSLTPPLATCGLSLAFGAFGGAWGAFLLFFANFLTILAVSAAIFILAGFVTRAELGTRADFMRRFSAAGIGLLAVAAVLTHQLVTMIDNWRVKEAIVRTIEGVLTEYPNTRLSGVTYEQSARDPINVLASVNTPRPISPQSVKELQDAISAAIHREVNLFVRCAITNDVAAAGSANLLPAVDLDGKFIDANATPNVRMTQTAEQVLRELVSRAHAFELKDLELINLPSGPVIVATVHGARAPTPSQIKSAEDAIRERLGDLKPTLLVRLVTTTDITSKGRVLLGEAQFAPLPPAEREVQRTLESLGKKEMESYKNTFVNGIDAAKRENGWEVRMEVVSAHTLLPDEVGKVEKKLADAAGQPVKLSVLIVGGLIVQRDGVTTVQRYIDAALAARAQQPR